MSRYRPLGFFYGAHVDSGNATAIAADEIIDTPDKHLLTQEELYWAEGGIIGSALQVGGIIGGAMLLFRFKPSMATYLRNAQLRSSEWMLLGGSAFVGYQGAFWAGKAAFGDRQKVQNHWMAYHFVKSCNRFEGRQILSNKHGY